VGDFDQRRRRQSKQRCHRHLADPVTIPSVQRPAASVAAYVPEQFADID
jgi:hypothetical protein